MRVLGVIPARGGSKGILRKNIAPLAGRPLLAYTAEAALGARSLSRIVLSTEDEEIAEVGRRYGLDVPFMRDADLARDDTPGIAVLQDAVRKLESQGDVYDAIFTLQPTNPLRRPEDIDGAVRLLEQTGADSVISFVPVGEKHPARMKFIDDGGRVVNPPFAERYEGQRRQELPMLYLREGSVYLTKHDVLMVQNSLQGNDCRAWIVATDRACNIDEPLDLLVAELLLKRHGLLAQPIGLSDHATRVSRSDVLLVT
jgi:CMP-N-acetylneuraminic acid synthetase